MKLILIYRGICYAPVSVCLSVTSRCSIETVEWTELIFGTEAAPGLFYAVF